MKTKTVVSAPLIENKIYIIRGKKVMLDFDLAYLYEVKTKALNQAVRRNKERFPFDFIFQLNAIEAKDLRSQIVTANSLSINKKRFLPFAFTEPGVAMLSSVLRSKRAIAVNIQIIRTFIKLRQLLASHQELKEKIEELEKKYDSQFKVVFDVIQKLIAEEIKPKQKIGFNTK